MNTNIKSVCFAFLLGIVVTSFQCKKDDPVPKTYVTIEFVDHLTGQPLDMVLCYIGFYNPDTGAGYSSNNVTGTDGQINLEIIDGATTTAVDAYREGYGPVSITLPGITRGETNRIVIPMYRFNCSIRLEVKNNTAQTDSVLIRAENGYLLSNGLFSFAQFPYYNPIEVKPFETQTYFVPAISDDPVSIFWSWKPNEWSAELPLKKVLILAENDTLTYVVSN